VRVYRLPIVSILALALALQAKDESGASARYVGGTVAAMTTDTQGKLHTTDDLFLEFRSRKRELNVPYDKINLLEYGQNVNRRLGLAIVISPMFLLSKSRRHYLTIGYTDSDGKQQAMVFQVDKGNIRAMLVSLEARTGLKIEYQDNEARKAGKG
jgi:hypothetical protein